MSKVHAQATCRLSMIPAKTSMLAGHFVYNSSNLGDSTPPGANVIQTAFVNNTDVTSLPAQWESNVHIGANGIQLRYNEIVLSEWVAKKNTKNGVNIDPNFTFYYPKEEQTSGSGGESLLVPAQGLSALKLSAGGMSLYRDSSDINEDRSESARKLFDLGNSGLIFYSGGTNSTPIARFNGSGVQIGKNGVVNAYVTSNSFVLRNENVSPTRTFFKVKDGLIETGTYIDNFIGDGTKTSFDLSYNADSSAYTIKKNNIEVGSTEVNKTTSSFTFNNAPAEGDVITATYSVTRPSTSSCTFGIRESNSVEGDYSVAEGYETVASRSYSHAEGYRTISSAWGSHSEGSNTIARGPCAHAEGYLTEAGQDAPGLEGYVGAHAEGYHTIATTVGSHAEGYGTSSYTIKATGWGAHAEGMNESGAGSGGHRTASGKGSHIEGYGRGEAKGIGSHVEGGINYARGRYDHVEGHLNETTGVYGSSPECSHVEGWNCKAYRNVDQGGMGLHAQNIGTIADGVGQTAIGRYNIHTYGGKSDSDKDSTAFIIGNGTGTADRLRSNALTVDFKGNLWIAGTLTTENNISAKSVTATMGLTVPSGGITLHDYNITLQMDSINASQANNNISSTQYPTAFLITDIGKKTLVRIEGIIESNGNIGSYWYVRNYNTSGTQVAQKGIKMTMDKSGNLTYTIQDAANFRTALGLGSLATKNSLSASDVSALPSNYFIFDPYSLQITVGQGATNITMGTLKQHSGYTLRGYINQNGGYTDQWLISYGTYGLNVVAMVYSKYNGSLTQTISCTAVWTKNS